MKVGVYRGFTPISILIIIKEIFLWDNKFFVNLLLHIESEMLTFTSFKERQVIEAIRKKAKEILPSGSRIRLFGSRARGDNRVDSDWDIHILIPGEEKLPPSLRSDLCYPFEMMGWEMDEEINILIHTFPGWQKRSFLPLFKNIETEGIDL